MKIRKAGKALPSTPNAQKKKASKPKQKPKQRKLTAEEIAERSHLKALEKQQRRESFAAASKVFLKRFVLFLIMFAVMFSVSTGIFFLTLSMHSGADKRSFIYQVGEGEENTVIRQYSPEQLERNGVVYVNFSEIAEMCDMAVTGDITEERFIVKNGDNDFVRFEIDTRYAVVNGVEIRLSSESYRNGKEVFVPIDFVDTYLLGVEVSYEKEEKKVTVWREYYPQDAESDEDSERIPLPVSFLLKKATPSEMLPKE